jgi:hypothetical protein
VLFASGHQASDVLPAAPAGFLHKPYTLTALAAAVRTALDAPAPQG